VAIAEARLDTLPEVPFRPRFLQRVLEKPTAQLLRLVDEEGEHHQNGKDRTQVLFTEAVIVTKIVPLIFKSIECLVLHGQRTIIPLPTDPRR